MDTTIIDFPSTKTGSTVADAVALPPCSSSCRQREIALEEEIADLRDALASMALLLVGRQSLTG